MARMRMSGDRRRLYWCLLVFSFVVSWGVWYWAKNMLVPVSTARALAGGRPVGNNSDLYPRWLGAREALLYHRDPYSPAVTREIQMGYYGRPLDAKRPADPEDQQAFAYPLYVVFLVAPSALFPFHVVMEGFGWLLLLGTACSVPLWMPALGLRAPAVVVLAAMMLALSTYPVVQGFYKQQLTLLVGFLLAAAAAAAVRGWLAMSGFLLALSTIKPQISGLLIFWFVVWAIGEWKSRKPLLWSFGGTMAVLVIGAEILQAGWMREFAGAVRDYRRYAADEPILQVLLTPLGGRIAAAALIVFLMVICWRWRKTAAGSDGFGWVIALAAAITLAILNKSAPYNHVLLIPAVLWLAARYADREKLHVLNRHRGTRAAMKAVLACLLWQWVTALLLSGCSLLIPAGRVAWAVQGPLYTVFALPVAGLAAVVLTMPVVGERPQALAARRSH